MGIEDASPETCFCYPWSAPVFRVLQADTFRIDTVKDPDAA